MSRIDNAVLDQLFQEYYNEAKLYTYSLTKDMHLAEDIVMDAFYKAVMAKDMEGETFKFWLLRVCRNRFLDYVRKNKRLCSIDKVKEEGTDDHEIDKLIKDEEYASLYRAIGLLDDIYREAIVLYYFERLSVVEIGKILDKTPEYVRVILMRAKAKLRGFLEESEQ